ITLNQYFCMLWPHRCFIFCPFLNWIIHMGDYLSFISSLYILDNNPLLDMSFVNIFSHSIGCLLVLLIVSFTVQKLFILMKSQ
uniref:Uncharacterized protein n=1 Tax=Felis catus TaxID=9685 RepID=A0ABI7ZA79_FELCA